MPMTVRTFQKCVWVPLGCTLPSWGSWLIRRTLPCLPVLHLPLYLEEQAESERKVRSHGVAGLRTLLSEQPQAGSRLGTCWLYLLLPAHTGNPGHNKWALQ